jgi:NtrC-family two-component system sensor histidine kinase KinB
VEREGGASQEGTGLGLSIAKKSIELLGETISADSDVGAGTTFTLRIRDYQPQAG